MDTDVNGLGVLSRAEALSLLETGEVGPVVYTRRALPAVLPVNYAVREGGIWIWTASASSLGLALRGAVVGHGDGLGPGGDRWAEAVTADTALAVVTG
jgi:hypothetical protein